MPFGVNEVRLWRDPILECDRVGKRIDLLGIHGSIAPEAATMQQINHPNVVEVVAAARIPDYPRPMEVIEIVTPYYPMGSVTDALLRGERFLASEAISITRSALLGLEELHEVHNLCHRDIKGGNVLLRDRQTGVIADLGLAGRMDSTGSIVGLQNATLYSPPELIVAHAVDRSGDLYSIALVLRELIAGPFPYSDYTRSEIIDALVKGKAPVRAVDCAMPIWAPSSLGRIFNKATSRVKSKRFQRARDLHAALGSVRVLDWVEVDPHRWVAQSGQKRVQVDLNPTRRGHELSLRVDRGRGWRRHQPAITITGIDDPALRRAFDTANTL